MLTYLSIISLSLGATAYGNRFDIILKFMVSLVRVVDHGFAEIIGRIPYFLSDLELTVSKLRTLLQQWTYEQTLLLCVK